MADPEPSANRVTVDEREAGHLRLGASPAKRSRSRTPDARKQSTVEEYYASRPKHDKLGNPIPERRKASAMASVFRAPQVRLPGDLGPNDPRRPKSPAPATLPGDLGPNDPRRPGSSHASPAPGHRRTSSDTPGSPGPGRILKDPKPLAADASEDIGAEADADNDNDTDGDDAERGRNRMRPEPGKTTAGKAVNVRSDSVDSIRKAPKQAQEDHKPDPTKGESAIMFKFTPPAEKRRVHPSTAYDHTPSAANTPIGSDDESHADIRAAQKLSLNMSALHSTPSAHRVIRQIIRGDYAHFQREAEHGRKRQRMYLVATDSSPEAEYALEWTIGTVLRDGDTLFAVYAVDEDTAGSGGVEIGHGAESVRDTAAIVRGLPTTTAPTTPSPLSKPSAFTAGGGMAETSTPDTGSRSRNGPSPAEAERRRAAEAVTERCIRLLRKTRLQVRVVVEVFHCKSPRHMITEVIDFLSPTLVIIGSRGRSAVKGVLLGSFSNYLVSKSSVPVMVARKKLRKHSKAVRNRDGTLVPYSGVEGRKGGWTNVLSNPKGAGLRVKGWESVGID
ncbi:hypothetical protein B0A48_01780 [Cryoendolithus antarcticus]|uniref:UspA domain-containing protein n=1 Tax=Cryoendolithus antarcticus TaxID=1507870 RepID=A0A1V8TQN4_9PEZI|nr:hypothetical protein B0A48_01780 [Cryoendolithus antarcticus]